MSSLIGKQVFNVPPESVGDVQNVLAVCDAGQFNNKVCGWCHASPLLSIMTSCYTKIVN